ncbi:MAG: NADH:flavin oxidoreductase/NADH oxidase [Nevskia sp.]|nr:NADH:flavin oxidoreductase/NADH oxidase [Nevskia sp.]
MLFEALQLRALRLRNRVVVSPMCQYSADDGFPTHWHLVHLGSRAIGGAGLVIVEATAVSADGRISPGDAGIYHDAHVEAWAPIARFISAAGAIADMQLAHAGRKASTDLPWKGGQSLSPQQGGWRPIVAPSAIAFDERSIEPHALSIDGIRAIVADFRNSAQRARDAGFELIELHGAHGYLLHEFLSPLSNYRDDQYGGSFDNRTRFLREVVGAVREVWPERLPLFVRISATDWAEAGGAWDIEQSVELARQLKPLGVDLIDVSSGGSLPRVKIPVGPGFQVPFAARIRREANIATGAVGVITEPAQAAQIVQDGEADLVLLAREFLRDPYWTYHAARKLGIDLPVPQQYQRAW